MPRLLVTLAVLTTAIVSAAGCGNDSSSASGAASLAPAGAVVYGEATLRPEGDQKAAIDALVAKFPGEGTAGERISRLLEKALAESDPELSWKRDFEPWIGDDAAFFVSGVRPNRGDANVAVLVATEDEDATVATLEKDEGGRKTDYRGHDLYVFPEQDSAAAAVDGWLVLGNPGGVKAAIDVAEGGDPIEDDDAYERTLEDAPEERLGFVYVNGRAFAEQLDKSPAGAALGGQLRRLLAEPVLATLDADESGIRFEATVPESYLASFPFIAEGSDLAAGLPADSWLAMAQPELGKLIDAYIDLVAGTVGGRDVIAQQFRAATGLDLEDDLISWMGDWGLFVRGTSVAELHGAIVIETSDEAASGRVIDAVARLARRSGDVRVGPLELPGGGEGVTVRSPDVPQPVHLFQRDGKVVAAYGDSAAGDALDPRETLGDSASFAAAEDALGEDYPLAFYVAMEPLLALVDSTEAASDPDWQEAKPYLEPLDAIVAGARKDGDKLRSVFGVTVK
jgi:hypothetical protein